MTVHSLKITHVEALLKALPLARQLARASGSLQEVVLVERGLEIPMAAGCLRLDVPGMEIPQDFPRPRILIRALQIAAQEKRSLDLRVEPTPRSVLYPPLESPVLLTLRWGAYTVQINSSLSPSQELTVPPGSAGVSLPLRVGELVYPLRLLPIRPEKAVFKQTGTKLHCGLLLAGKGFEMFLDVAMPAVYHGVTLPPGVLQALAGSIGSGREAGSELTLTRVPRAAHAWHAWSISGGEAYNCRPSGFALSAPSLYAERPYEGFFYFRASALEVDVEKILHAITECRRLLSSGGSRREWTVQLAPWKQGLSLVAHAGRARVPWPWVLPVARGGDDCVREVQVSGEALFHYLKGTKDTRLIFSMEKAALKIYGTQENGPSFELTLK